MERSRCPLMLAGVLIGAVAFPATSRSHAPHAPRSRPPTADAPVQHATPYRAVQHRVVAPPVHHTSTDSRHKKTPWARVVVRYIPVVRVAAVYPVAPPPVVALPVLPPNIIAAVSQPAQTIAALPSAGYPPDWNWRPVESFAALVPRSDSSAASGQQNVRYYCPEMREYFPQVETCDSSWLKVIP